MIKAAALLFDLDGTLLDSAPDLVAALNHARALEELPALPLPELRHMASRGARGLVAAGFSGSDDEHLQQQRINALLQYYAAHDYVHTRAFAGVEAVLDELDRRAIPWGIVTNKIERLTIPVVKQAGWWRRAACVVCGDTTSRPKPDPGPVLSACEALAVKPDTVWMIGDDRRDVVAGRDAGCRTAVASWGYLGPDESARSLDGDVILANPGQILDLAPVQTMPAGHGFEVRSS